jgi:diguanylate cyclase (GGDEF)-like protein/PAS domain S-box-containing protein
MTTSPADAAPAAGASHDASRDACVDARLLAELLDTSTELVCATDAAGRIVYVNAAWERALGYPRDEACALPVVALVAPEERAAYHAAARRLAAGERVDPFELVLTARDGRRVACRGVATPVMVRDGDRSRCVGTRAAYRALSEAQAEERTAARRFALLIGAMQDAVFVLDRQGTYVEVLETARALLLRSADQLRGRGVRDFFAPELAMRFLDGIARALDGAGPVTLDYALAIDGRERWFSATVSPMDAERVLFVARDVTAQKAAEAALRESEARHRALFERSSAVQWVVDPATRTIVDANEAAVRFYGYPLAALRGKPLREINVLPEATLRAQAARGDAGEGGVVPQRLASGEVRMVEYHPTRVELNGRTYLHSVLHDVTDRIRVETALRESESRLSLIYDSATDLMFLMAVERDPDGTIAGFRCESVNAAYLELTGLAAGQLVGRTLREILPEGELARVYGNFAEVVLSGDVRRHEEEFVLATGLLTVETTLTPVFDVDGVCTHVLGSARDVSARRHAEAALRESEARFRGVLETVRAVALTLDAEGCVTFANDALLELTGWSREEVVGRRWFDHFVPNGPAAQHLFGAMLRGDESVAHYENEILTRDGERRLIAWDNTLLRDADGRAAGTASIGRDITAQRALEARLAALSEHDELTGLLNRRGFRRMAEHELRVGRRVGRRGAVLYLDMDGFKQINDAHGHAEGDLALRAVADVLRTSIRDGDLAARLGGDEFVVYATGAATVDEGEALAARLREQLRCVNDAARAAGRGYALRFSVGVAMVDGADDLDGVLTRADAALYAGKLARRTTADTR